MPADAKTTIEPFEMCRKGSCQRHRACMYRPCMSAVTAPQEVFVHVAPTCDHEFAGWRNFEDGSGGEQVCQKCGTGAMAWSMGASE